MRSRPAKIRVAASRTTDRRRIVKAVRPDHQQWLAASKGREGNYEGLDAFSAQYARGLAPGSLRAAPSGCLRQALTGTLSLPGAPKNHSYERFSGT
jgi:hypothetical protein